MSDPGIVTEGYGGRVGYTDRCGMYAAVYGHLMRLGLAEGDIVVDVGAGYCDFDMYLRQMGWFGRYVGVDPSIDPTVSLEDWTPSHPAHWYVVLDTTEHLFGWAQLLDTLAGHATKAVVVSTPNGDTVDVLAMHPSHVTTQNPTSFKEIGFEVDSFSLGAYEQMVAWKVSA